MSGYTHSEPFDIGLLPVGTLHRVYYEQYGRKDGKPGPLLKDSASRWKVVN
jgi:proline iminopeptidase